jgi:transcriptional regulator with XRE-family HTH domain
MFSQAEIAKRAGLFRHYISRVENGDFVPAVGTLEKLARALEVPLYHLFYDGGERPAGPDIAPRRTSDGTVWGSSRREAHELAKLWRLLSRTSDNDRGLLLSLARVFAQGKRPKASFNLGSGR